MAPLPEDSTARIRVNYRDQWNEHSLTFRFADLSTPSTALAAVEDVVGEMLALVWDNTVFHSADYALEGSNVFNPLPGWISQQPLGNGTPGANVSPARFFNFVGRSNTGRRARLYLFGVRYDEVQDMRYSSSENGGVAAVVDALNSHPEIVTIDGSSPIWKPYANYGFNDAITHKARG